MPRSSLLFEIRRCMRWCNWHAKHLGICLPLPHTINFVLRTLSMVELAFFIRLFVVVTYYFHPSIANRMFVCVFDLMPQFRANSPSQNMPHKKFSFSIYSKKIWNFEHLTKRTFRFVFIGFVRLFSSSSIHNEILLDEIIYVQLCWCIWPWGTNRKRNVGEMKYSCRFNEMETQRSIPTWFIIHAWGLHSCLGV